MSSNPRCIPGRLLVGIALHLVATCVVAQQQGYPLDGGDRLRVTVLDRPELSGTYTVGVSGEVSIPLVGRVLARGADERALESALTKALAARQSATPYVAVEVEAYRPVYVDGDVTKAGAYPFVPGLTVRDALALAGGRLSLRSTRDYSALDRARDEETLAVLVDSYRANVVREARLVSERDDRAELHLPDGIAAREGQARVKEAVASETRLFEARAAIVDGQAALLAERIRQYDHQIDELTAEQSGLVRKRSLTQEMVDATESLTKKGVAPRRDFLQMQINNIEADRDVRQNSVLILDATLGRNEAQQSTVNLRAQRAAAVADELVSVRNLLAQNLARIRSTASRLQPAADTSGGGTKPADEPPFLVTRRDHGARVEVRATLDTPLRPADSLNVPFPAVGLVSLERLDLPPRVRDPTSAAQPETP